MSPLIGETAVFQAFLPSILLKTENLTFEIMETPMTPKSLYTYCGLTYERQFSIFPRKSMSPLIGETAVFRSFFSLIPLETGRFTIQFPHDFQGFLRV
jgi:hypothetical protein